MTNHTTKTTTTTSGCIYSGLRKRPIRRRNKERMIMTNRTRDINSKASGRPSTMPLMQFRTVVNPQRSLDDYLEDAYSTVTSPENNDNNQNNHTGMNCWNIPWNYWFVMLSLGVANSSDASEILCISYILSNEDFERHILLQSEWRGGLLASTVFFGMLLGGLLLGTLGDWVGRRPMLLIGLCCNAIAGILSAAATDVWTLSLLRCFAGVGIGATVPPLFTLVTELAPPSQRGFFVTVCASFWMVGSVYVAVTALLVLEYAHLSWRVFAVLCAVPSALGAVLVRTLVPESPRFLALQQKQEQALEVVNNLASQMDYQGPMLTLSELEQHFPSDANDNELNSNHSGSRRDGRSSVTSTTIAAANTSRGSIAQILKGVRSLGRMINVALKDFQTSASKLYSPNMRQTTWPLQMVWFSLSFGSYGLLTWINTLFVQVHLENLYVNALLFALSNLPGNILSAWLMDRVGRAVMLIGSVLMAAASLMSFAWFASFPPESLHGTGIVVSACAFQCFTVAAWNTIDVMTSELFPTTVRSTGIGVCAASGRVGAMVAQFVNGILVAKPVRLLLVASITLLLGATTPCLLPGGDMTGQPVQDEMTNWTITTTAMGEGDHEGDDEYYDENMDISMERFQKSDDDPSFPTSMSDYDEEQDSRQQQHQQSLFTTNGSSRFHRKTPSYQNLDMP